MGYKVAVIGATGNVGREMLNILAEREFPADEVFAIASRRSMGVEVSYGDQRLKCRDLENFDFRGDRKSTRQNSSHYRESRMPSSA